MDAKKEALRRILVGMKGAPSNEEAVEGDGQKSGSDLAPDLKQEESPELEVSGEVPADPEMLMQILEALGDHSSGAGRGPGGLQERVAMGAKKHMADMKNKGMKK